jgi:hypothetical protein
VRINYANWPTFLIAYLVARDLTAVYQLAAKLGLKKSARFFASEWSGRTKAGRHPASIAHQFKPGQTPPNKGVRRPGWAPGRMSQTQFKKGRLAHEARNYKPIGSLRITRDGQLERKVTDDPSIYPARRWTAVTRLIWESVNGPIPSGHIVRFRAGMKTMDPALITVDRLELVTHAENMRRNTIHNLPPALKQVIQLNAAIKHRITNRERKRA